MRTFLGATLLIGLMSGHAYAETDWVQLASNMIWCYQNPNHVSEPYVDGWSTWVKSADGQTWVEAKADVKVSRSRSEYVRDIQIAAARKDAAMAKNIYMMCQRHSARPLDYGNEASEAQWIGAVVHAAACYDPNTGTNSPRIRKSGEIFQSPFGPITCIN